MNHKEYCQAVENKKYPKNPICPIGSSFINDAGEIKNIIESCNLNSVAIIHSFANKARSNHYHTNENYHFLFCISGLFEYYERDIDEVVNEETFKPILVKAGEMIFTPPNKVHLIIFKQDTVLLSLGKNPRDHSSHEETLIREKFFK